ncbi:GTPase-activator protein for ras GTPase [Ophiocordyceps camponoti-floridani]|uniref:GTPase-activator protein for ras GTPase n=1 Tax=Ophiocordyceps camponoti-floridani TaxID=2030778 RepID=A0A8H4VGW7_9HYPO|nr:GTPase-activator protein for ras GTPase [Ophiocordyceps camponoti-floridani]
MTWYHCPVHRRYHAISFLSSGKEQPLCGECAVVFFSRMDGKQWETVWTPSLDKDAIVTRSLDLIEFVDADEGNMLGLLQLMYPWQGPDPDDGDEEVTYPPEQRIDDVFDAIPMDDETYMELETELIFHPPLVSVLSGVVLLRFMTYQGVVAYQPCSKQADRLFEALNIVEDDVDPIFKQAREWSCAMQAHAYLSKEMRWVLATVYNFSCEMLRPEVKEKTLYWMRTWLMFWYDVFDRIAGSQLVGFEGVKAPEPDWFARPKRGTTRPVREELLQAPPQDMGSETMSDPVWKQQQQSLALVRGWLDSQTRVGRKMDPRAAVFKPRNESSSGYPRSMDSGYASCEPER